MVPMFVLHLEERAAAGWAAGQGGEGGGGGGTYSGEVARSNRVTLAQQIVCSVC